MRCTGLEPALRSPSTGGMNVLAISTKDDSSRDLSKTTTTCWSSRATCRSIRFEQDCAARRAIGRGRVTRRRPASERRHGSSMPAPYSACSARPMRTSPGSAEEARPTLSMSSAGRKPQRGRPSRPSCRAILRAESPARIFGMATARLRSRAISASADRRSAAGYRRTSARGPHGRGQVRTLGVRPARCGPDPERAEPNALRSFGCCRIGGRHG